MRWPATDSSPNAWRSFTRSTTHLRSAKLHPKYDTPSVAIVIQSVWATVLVFTGTYGQLVDYVVSADWIFFGAAGASVFVFRRRIPLAERAEGVFATPGYPLIPGLFVAASVLIVGSVIWTNPLRSGIGLGLLLAGVPAYMFWSRKLPAESDPSPAHGLSTPPENTLREHTPPENTPPENTP